MNRFFTLLFAASCLTAVGQVDFPWNPDTNDDGIVGAEDLLAFLAVYNGEWELPDPTEWATTTIINLLQLEAELDSIAITQQEVLTEVELAIIELQQIGDSLQSSGNTCYVLAGGSDSSPTASTPVPTSCRHVNIYTGYGSGSSWPLTLPIQGEFVGQTISFFLMPYGNANRTVPIQPHADDSLSDGAVLTPCNGSYCGGSLSSNWTVGGNSNHNKKFVWDGFRWELVSSGAITLSTSYN